MSDIPYSVHLAWADAHYNLQQQLKAQVETLRNDNSNLREQVHILQKEVDEVREGRDLLHRIAEQQSVLIRSLDADLFRLSHLTQPHENYPQPAEVEEEKSAGSEALTIPHSHTAPITTEDAHLISYLTMPQGTSASSNYVSPERTYIKEEEWRICQEQSRGSSGGYASPLDM